MKVSVLMPVYNKAAFVQEAVESILRGTFQDLEIVAVDDKSTDASLDVLRSIADPRLRILELAENRGPAGAANAGLDACTGGYIVRLDADDIALRDRIERQVAFMETHPDVGASGGQVQLFGAQERVWSFPLSPEDCAAQLLFSVPLSQGASILRRSVLEAHGLRYDPAWPRVGEDWLFWLRLGRVTRFANIDAPVIRYRRGPQNISQGRDRAADMAFLQRAAFDAFDVPFTQRELDLHLMGSHVFQRPPTKQDVRDLRQWYDRLVQWNAGTSRFPEPAFRLRVEKQWNALFHYLVRYGASPALEHLRLGRRWPFDRLLYLMKYRLNARLGRVPNG